MLERRSALATATPYKNSELHIAERRGFSLLQAAGLTDDFEALLAAALGSVPEKVGLAHDQDGRTIMRIGPSQFWIIAPEIDDLAVRLKSICAVTPLSHSRTRIGLSGAPARAVLSKLSPVDFHPKALPPGSFALTGIHHTPVTIHCTGDTAFDIYAMRTFALNVWEVITDAALEFAE